MENENNFDIEYTNNDFDSDFQEQNNIDTESELNEYSESVKERINKLVHAAQKERHERERLALEHEEAIRIAQAFVAENAQLKNTLNWGQGQFVEQYKTGISTEESLAKDKFKRAYEAGDVEALLEAQSVLNDIAVKKAQLPALQKPILPEASYQIPAYQNPVSEHKEFTPVRDVKAESWAMKNPWFGKDEEMTSLAYGVHTKLINSGFDPLSDEYYNAIDKAVRRRFPEKFKTQQSQTTSTVAPVSRTTASKKVTLSPSALAIAKRLGVTPEQYAKQVLLLEQKERESR